MSMADEMLPPAWPEPFAPPQTTVPLDVLMAHVCDRPADTLMYVPAQSGTELSESGSMSLLAGLPQHSGVWSVRMPHVCSAPASTSMNVPSGGVACPNVSSP